MTSKFSRAALIAGLAIGASGLVAVPADAALVAPTSAYPVSTSGAVGYTASNNAISTANYYVNNPTVAGASDITPESVRVAGAIDTGGNPETFLPVPSAGLTWDGSVAIGGGVQWADAPDLNSTTTKTVTDSAGGHSTSETLATKPGYVPVDGLPVSGSNSTVSATITDSAVSKTQVTVDALSNAGSPNYSDVTFEYDPVSDYDANGDQPGPQTNFAQDIEVPTAAGLSDVNATLGAFGQAAQNNTGNEPLEPGTQYYYWIVQQAGATTNATNVDISQWTNASSNPSYKCYPNVAIAADPTLASYTASTQITLDGTTAPALQGPCIYYYGNTGGALYYQSPNGAFTTPKLGAVKIAPKAAVKGKLVVLGVGNASAYKASGTIDLTVHGKLAGTARFSVGPKARGLARVKLTAKGKLALTKGETVKVAPISQVAAVASVSNWDQPFMGKSVKL